MKHLPKIFAAIAVLAFALLLAACGQAEVESRTECRTTADNRVVCTTYTPKESE